MRRGLSVPAGARIESSKLNKILSVSSGSSTTSLISCVVLTGAASGQSVSERVSASVSSVVATVVSEVVCSSVCLPVRVTTARAWEGFVGG